MALRLGGIRPDTEIVGIKQCFPELFEHLPKEIQSAFEDSDVIIDCTAHDSTLRWISSIGKDLGKTVIHLYINANASMLTLICSGKHADCVCIDHLLRDDILKNTCGFSMSEFNPQSEELWPGAGCWHSTFPARGHDIGVLVAAAIPFLEKIVSQDRKSSGTAIILRRKEIDNSIQVAPIVEVIWNQNYR